MKTGISVPSSKISNLIFSGLSSRTVGGSATVGRFWVCARPSIAARLCLKSFYSPPSSAEGAEGLGSVFCLATRGSSKPATSSFPGMGFGGCFSSSELDDECFLSKGLLTGNF